MKDYIVTYIETIERHETIKAINHESAMQLAEMRAHQSGMEFKSLSETIDMNKFLCKEL